MERRGSEKKNNIPSPEPVKFSLGHVLALENIAVLLSLRRGVHERSILALDTDGLFFLAGTVLHGDSVVALALISQRMEFKNGQWGDAGNQALCS